MIFTQKKNFCEISHVVLFLFTKQTSNLSKFDIPKNVSHVFVQRKTKFLRFELFVTKKNEF